ncbi:nucleotide sugar dehydrogenase [Clostridium cochlearium]|nr:nucleotide sugar dehydrogenase [Clostridium cochlearium]MCR1971702.1 nucleotide sugar dehydrogenase [Clostridium cochlearium]
MDILENKLTVNVIGLGYIGLPTALMFASHGVQVVGTDYNKNLINTLESGEMTFDEKGLDNLFELAVSKGIKFSSEYVPADIYIVAVPTPYNKLSKKIDASFIIEAIKEIIKICPKGSVVVIESTVSPGTIDKFIRSEIERSGVVIGEDVNIVHAPERIIPGNMIYELKHNSRTIGADDKEVGKKIKELYSTFCEGEIILTDIRTAEMTKVVENTYRDINIAFANELAKICRCGNMDVYEIIKISNMHPRVNILQPGPGVGGHCISVDPWFLVGDYPGLANIILAARNINDSMPEFVLERTHDIMKAQGITNLEKVGIYGLTYKENVDDVRESPTIQLLGIMEKHLAEPLKTYDPYVKKDIVKNQYHDFDAFLNDVDFVIIMVSHNEIIANIDKLKGKIILDTKNICNIEGTYKL